MLFVTPLGDTGLLRRTVGYYGYCVLRDTCFGAQGDRRRHPVRARRRPETPETRRPTYGQTSLKANRLLFCIKTKRHFTARLLWGSLPRQASRSSPYTSQGPRLLQRIVPELQYQGYARYISPAKRRSLLFVLTVSTLLQVFSWGWNWAAAAMYCFWSRQCELGIA